MKMNYIRNMNSYNIDTNSYPSGVPVDITAQVNPGVSGARTTDRLHIGNTWLDYEGIGWYDNRARYHDP